MGIRARARRLIALARRHGYAGCPACWERRGRVVLATAEVQADGTTRSVEGCPEPCPRCSEVPELVIEVVEVIVDRQAG
jgi:hypothetical protein